MAPFPNLSNVATPTKPIITIPITLYGYGMVMMPKSAFQNPGAASDAVSEGRTKASTSFPSGPCAHPLRARHVAVLRCALILQL